MRRPGDYYALLGVERNAEPEAIKRAFRTRARELHPDVSDAPGAEDRFRELAEAYGVLSAPNARLLYDRLGYLGPGNGGFADRGARVVAELVLTRPQAKVGGVTTIRATVLEVCEACSGEGAGGGETVPCATCRGSGFARHASQTSFWQLLELEDCSDCAGAGRVLARVCRECGGEGRIARRRERDVVVPAGTRDGDLVALGAGESVRVRVRPLVDESRVVRYGAAAAFAVAVAFIVFLLFFS